MSLVTKFVTVTGIALYLLFYVGTNVEAQAPKDNSVTRLDSLTVAELVERLEAAPPAQEFVFRNEQTYHYEAILSEMVRRGGPEAEKTLKETLAKRSKDLETAKKRLEKIELEKNMHDFSEANGLVSRLQDNLELLTALRRIQKHPDPLTVEVRLVRNVDAWNRHKRHQSSQLVTEFHIPSELTGTTRILPTFVVKLRSDDFEKLPVWIKYGGDYRSGREARWRFEVIDAKGHFLPSRPQEGFMGGGAYTENDLKHGDTWETALPMSDFVNISKPGEYTVSILYHNNLTIADAEDPADMNGLILFRSTPFKLKIEKGAPQVIQLNADSRKKAKLLIEALPLKGTILIVGGEYDDSFHDFLAPDSAAGQLLQMGWQAVPELLDALRGNRLHPHQKEWTLSLLHSITHERDLDPLKFDAVLSDYRWQSAPSCYGSGGAIVDPTQQKQLIEMWLEFEREYLEIRQAR